MSEIALHELPAAAALTGAEMVPVDDGSATVRTTVAAIRSGLSPQGHGHAVEDVAGLQAALDDKAPLAAPIFPGGMTVRGSAWLAGTAGAAGLTVAAPAAVANGLFVAGAVPGAAPYLQAAGSDAAIMLRLYAKGRAGIGLYTGGDVDGPRQVLILDTPGATHALTLTGSNGGDPAIGSESGRVAFAAIPTLPSFTVATLPTAAGRGVVYVSDGAANRRLAVSDGLVWRWPDGGAVS